MSPIVAAVPVPKSAQPAPEPQSPIEAVATITVKHRPLKITGTGVISGRRTTIVSCRGAAREARDDHRQGKDDVRFNNWPLLGAPVAAHPCQFTALWFVDRLNISVVGLHLDAPRVVRDRIEIQRVVSDSGRETSLPHRARRKLQGPRCDQGS